MGALTVAEVDDGLSSDEIFQKHMDIGSSIKYFRDQRGLSQKALAEAIGITASYLSLVESNQKVPTIGLLEEVARKFDVPLPILMFFALEEKDVSVRKRKMFRSLIDPVRSMVSSSFLSV